MRRTLLAVLCALLPLGLHAAAHADNLPLTATVSAWPYSGMYHVGQQFQVSIYLSGNGTLVWQASGGIALTPNLVLESVSAPQVAPGCDVQNAKGAPPPYYLPVYALASGTGAYWNAGYGEGNPPHVGTGNTGLCVVAQLNLRVVATGLGVVNVATGPCPPGLLVGNPACVWPADAAGVTTAGGLVSILKTTMDGVYTLVP